MQTKGFTLIEILVIIATLSLFLGLSIPQLRSFERASHLENAGNELTAALRLAHQRTLGSEEDEQYGVHLETTSTPHQYTLFQGASYETRDAAKDELTQLNKAVEISALGLGGADEVVFTRLTGTPSVAGTITLRLVSDPSRTLVVSILSSGAVQQGIALPASDDERIKDTRHVHVPYQGRNIDTAGESMRLVFPDTMFSVAIADNMSGGQIFWEGDVVSEGENQHLKIHTHLLNDPSQGSLFSLHRERDKNTKALSIELSGDATGDLISYDATGTITQGTSIYAGTPEAQ